MIINNTSTILLEYFIFGKVSVVLFAFFPELAIQIEGLM